MADMVNGYTDCSLHLGHGAIRHDVALAEANIRDSIGREACGINHHIGDMRQEDAENFGHARRDIQSTSADIRREVAEQNSDVREEVSREGQETIIAVKDARCSIQDRISEVTGRIVDRMERNDDKNSERFFVVGRDLAELRQGHATLEKDIELNALKTQIEGQKNTQYLSDKITVEGDRTRTLINDLKYHDLNRVMLERQNALVNCEQDRRCYEDRCNDRRFDQFQAQFAGQWAQLQNQVQAFQSQLQETRQGMVNFGTMAGVGQTSTSNNVR